jgi:hypothetical protein
VKKALRLVLQWGKGSRPQNQQESSGEWRKPSAPPLAALLPLGLCGFLTVSFPGLRPQQALGERQGGVFSSE